MRKFGLSAFVMTAILLCGLSTNAIAAATPPAVAPAISASVDGHDVVFTFPEGVDPKTVSFKLRHHVMTRHHIAHHEAIRWTSPTEMRMPLHLLLRHSCCRPNEGLWVEGEAKGYIALLQFVIIQNMPVHCGHWHCHPRHCHRR
jgi:hypothetical protein